MIDSTKKVGIHRIVGVPLLQGVSLDNNKTDRLLLLPKINVYKVTDLLATLESFVLLLKLSLTLYAN